jgi:hypothetical protein
MNSSDKLAVSSDTYSVEVAFERSLAKEFLSFSMIVISVLKSFNKLTSLIFFITISELEFVFSFKLVFGNSFFFLICFHSNLILAIRFFFLICFLKNLIFAILFYFLYSFDFNEICSKLFLIILINISVKAEICNSLSTNDTIPLVFNRLFALFQSS